MSIDNNNPQLTKFLNPYYLEQNDTQNFYNSLDSTSRNRSHIGGAGANGPAQIPYIPEYEKEAKFLAHEEQEYANRVNVNDVMHSKGNTNGYYDQPEQGEMIDLPHVTQKVPTTRALPDRTKTTLFKQAYGNNNGNETLPGGAQAPLVAGNIKKSNIKPVNHFRALATNMTTDSAGDFQAATAAEPAAVGVGTSAAIAPKGSKQAAPVGVGTSGSSVHSHSRASVSKRTNGDAKDAPDGSTNRRKGTITNNNGNSKELQGGSKSLFNENLDYQGSVVSALTMISQQEDHEGL